MDGESVTRAAAPGGVVFLGDIRSRPLLEAFVRTRVGPAAAAIGWTPQPGAGDKDFLEELNPDSLKVVTGYVEPSLAKAKGDEKFQFERHGYFVADRRDHDSAAGRPVFALDVPSGMNADTGATLGVCVRAQVTITFGHPRSKSFAGK